MSPHKNNLCVSLALFLGLGINKYGTHRLNTLNSLHKDIFSRYLLGGLPHQVEWCRSNIEAWVICQA